MESLLSYYALTEVPWWKIFYTESDLVPEEEACRYLKPQNSTEEALCKHLQQNGYAFKRGDFYQTTEKAKNFINQYKAEFFTDNPAIIADCPHCKNTKLDFVTITDLEVGEVFAVCCKKCTTLGQYARTLPQAIEKWISIGKNTEPLGQQKTLDIIEKLEDDLSAFRNSLESLKIELEN